jgi:ApbE superfamily uncharacterized protein (UPF0280 family)
MKVTSTARMLPDGRRLHLHDGPIDLIVEAFGAERNVRRAYLAATERFTQVLPELCQELPALRSAEPARHAMLRGPVARRMAAAIAPFVSDHFLTPMAAVAGAVAEEILQTMVQSERLDRAYVNNGGDIAVHLSPGTEFAVGMVERPDRRSLMGTMCIPAGLPVRGIATSGWRGRSFSLGIADAVTVLAESASVADAAATLVANAVDLPGHPAIRRAPASELEPDSDLGPRLVTCDVGKLFSEEIDQALDAGLELANHLICMGCIRAAALSLAGERRLAGVPTPSAHLLLHQHRFPAKEEPTCLR